MHALSPGCCLSTSRTPSSTSRPRPTSIARSTGPGAFIQTNIVGTFTLLRGGAATTGSSLPTRRRTPASVSCMSRPTRSTARSGADDALHRDDALRAELALLGLQGGVRSPGARLASHLRPAGADTNCSNNYGPYQFPEKLIPLMILNALEGKPLPVYGDGRERARLALRRRPCRAILRVLETGRPARPTTSAATASGRTSRW